MGVLSGSTRTAPGPLVGSLPADSTVEVTVVLPPREPLPAPGAAPLDRDVYAARHGARPDDVEAVRAFATGHGLSVVASDEAARTVRVGGPLSAVQAAFGVELGEYGTGDATFRGRSGPITVPDELDDKVVAVLGLDQRRVAWTRYRRAAAAAAATSPLTALQVAQAYDFPAGDGAGQTIALIELGGGYEDSDLSSYFSGLGLTAPQVSAVGVQGGENVPGGDPDGADGEVELDIEVAGAVAPGAKVVVYFSPNTDDGFLAAINAAIHATPAPAAISISWGGPESSWTGQSLTAFDQAFASAAALGIAVFAAAGDSGSSDGTGTPVADFPASSPNVTGCGGTRLVLDGSGRRSAETVWNDDPTQSATGGGYSTTFPRPSYQPATVGDRRGVPDVTGNADPDTGYRVRVDGSDTVVGGTSAVAPLLAGLAARLATLASAPVGLLNTVAYAHPDDFVDVTAGGNGAYNAAPGWDPTSGLGAPDGTKLLGSLTV